jgi:hypothetical protein
MYVIMDVFSVMSPSLMALRPVVQEIQTKTDNPPPKTLITYSLSRWHCSRSYLLEKALGQFLQQRQKVYALAKMLTQHVTLDQPPWEYTVTVLGHICGLAQMAKHFENSWLAIAYFARIMAKGQQ